MATGHPRRDGGLAKQVLAFFLVGPHGPVYHLSIPDQHFALTSQILAFAALDAVEMQMKVSKSRFVRLIDRFADHLVSAYLGNGSSVLVVHSGADEAQLVKFCSQLHALYCKHVMNPLYEPGSVITSAAFDRRSRLLANGILGMGLEVAPAPGGNTPPSAAPTTTAAAAAAAGAAASATGGGQSMRQMAAAGAASAGRR